MIKDDRFNFEARDPNNFSLAPGAEENNTETWFVQDYPVMLKDRDTGEMELITCTIPYELYELLNEEEYYRNADAIKKLGRIENFIVAIKKTIELKTENLTRLEKEREDDCDYEN